MEIYIELTSFNNVYSDINNLEMFYKQLLPFYAMKTKLYIKKYQPFRDFNLNKVRHGQYSVYVCNHSTRLDTTNIAKIQHIVLKF